MDRSLPLPLATKAPRQAWSPVSAELVAELVGRNLSRTAIAVYLAIRAVQPRIGRGWDLSRRWLESHTRPSDVREDTHRRAVSRALAALETCELLTRDYQFDGRSGRQRWSTYRVAELVDTGVHGRGTTVSPLIEDQEIDLPSPVGPPTTPKRPPMLAPPGRGGCAAPATLDQWLRGQCRAVDLSVVQGWLRPDVRTVSQIRAIAPGLPDGVRRRQLAAWLATAAAAAIAANDVGLLDDDDDVGKVPAELDDDEDLDDLDGEVPLEDLAEGLLDRPAEGLLDRPAEGLLDRLVLEDLAEGLLDRPAEGLLDLSLRVI